MQPPSSLYGQFDYVRAAMGRDYAPDDYDAVQEAFDKADADIIREFIGTIYSTPLGPQRNSIRLVSRWANELTIAYLRDDTPAREKVMREIAQVKADESLDAVMKAPSNSRGGW